MNSLLNARHPTRSAITCAPYTSISGSAPFDFSFFFSYSPSISFSWALRKDRSNSKPLGAAWDTSPKKALVWTPLLSRGPALSATSGHCLPTLAQRKRCFHCFMARYLPYLAILFGTKTTKATITTASSSANELTQTKQVSILHRYLRDNESSVCVGGREGRREGRTLLRLESSFGI